MKNVYVVQEEDPTGFSHEIYHRPFFSTKKKAQAYAEKRIEEVFDKVWDEHQLEDAAISSSDKNDEYAITTVDPQQADEVMYLFVLSIIEVEVE